MDRSAAPDFKQPDPQRGGGERQQQPAVPSSKRPEGEMSRAVQQTNSANEFDHHPVISAEDAQADEDPIISFFDREKCQSRYVG